VYNLQGLHLLVTHLLVAHLLVTLLLVAHLLVTHLPVIHLLVIHILVAHLLVIHLYLWCLLVIPWTTTNWRRPPVVECANYTPCALPSKRTSPLQFMGVPAGPQWAIKAVRGRRIGGKVSAGAGKPSSSRKVESENGSER
jgi:hypothetical protein